MRGHACAGLRLSHRGRWVAASLSRVLMENSELDQP